ncbi:hypothetical protein LZK98_04780 [Sphingomonas cannabina]|uniref:hypothetical protein n=1 Tax=Sphingomonas cannabina TaxID=2899123 RepID=UPI001F1FD5ED|nr:hypothetical protein [Sphingomonas cannabina]UIJ46265.1 hypothetical protein LZK98_04780 [Sphingomonas cannabina]
MVSDDARTRLINHLDGVAGYNDKGYYWSGHTPDEVRANQEEAQAVIMRLVAEIGEDAFSLDLLQKLKSGAASTDDSGDIVLQAKGELPRAW